MTGQFVGMYGTSLDAIEVNVDGRKIILATGATWPNGGLNPAVTVWMVVDNAQYESPLREIPAQVEEMVHHYLKTGEMQRVGFNQDGSLAIPPTARK